ncbi:MAG: ABC transporter ATP-binding protein [Thaumarchaeota archaeon]|nr:ABC transporter ATP-binding protein [Nitrososphaerota archaeon]
MSETPPIRIRGLSHTYGTAGEPVPALDGIDLDVGRGEFVSVIGPSGCGKTTLLYIIAALIRPTSVEQLLVEGREMKKPDPGRVALVFQDSGLLFWKTVLANVEFGLELRGVSKEARASRAREQVKAVGLEGFERRYPAELSGGMKQRASLARALTLDAPILLMDEPFGALDEQTRMLMAEEMLRICADGKRTVILVTHSLQEAATLSDRIVVLSARPGRVHATITMERERPRTPIKIEETREQLWALLKGLSAEALHQEREDRLR